MFDYPGDDRVRRRACTQAGYCYVAGHEPCDVAARGLVDLAVIGRTREIPRECIESRNAPCMFDGGPAPFA